MPMYIWKEAIHGNRHGQDADNKALRTKRTFEENGLWR